MNEFILSMFMAFGLAEAPENLQVEEAPVSLHYAKPQSIPPNCTMDPWTGKYTCHKWPTPKPKLSGVNPS
jgi:hypothetical protein